MVDKDWRKSHRRLGRVDQRSWDGRMGRRVKGEVEGKKRNEKLFIENL